MMHSMSFPIHPEIIEAYAFSRKKLEPIGRYTRLKTILNMNSSIDTMKASLNFVGPKDYIGQLKYHPYYTNRQGMKEALNLPTLKSSVMKAIRRPLLFIT